VEKETNNNEKKEQLNKSNNFLKYSGLGFQMIGTIGLAAWAGIKLDEHFHIESHMFTVGLMLLGVIGSMYLVIKGLMK
jgi:ATP synthase protein I